MTCVKYMPCIVVAGLGSGVGKTSLAVGLTRALRIAGYTVATFKVGPDYLDPSYLAMASGRPCHNLDSWMMGHGALLSTYLSGCKGADIAIVEGVMGLFDSIRAGRECGSTAEVAKWLDAPVLLCMDASGMSTTFAAIANGVAGHDLDVAYAGIIANRVGSARHAGILKTALRATGGPPLLGFLGKKAAPPFPSRNLGLQTAGYGGANELSMAAWGSAVSAGVDVEGLVRLSRARSSPVPSGAGIAPVGGQKAATGLSSCTIAVARDAAFNFYYPWNLAALERAGATLAWFSPLSDCELPVCDGLLIGGGHPEVHAHDLTANAGMRASILAHVRAGKPTYAECGGFMYLSSGIETYDGIFHRMVGAVPGGCRVKGNLAALGYVRGRVRERSSLGPQGQILYGHQFRYSERIDCSDAALSLSRVRDGQPMDAGVQSRGLVASYVHCHWARTPEIPVHFVLRCVRVRDSFT